MRKREKERERVYVSVDECAGSAVGPSVHAHALSFPPSIPLSLPPSLSYSLPPPWRVYLSRRILRVLGLHLRGVQRIWVGLGIFHHSSRCVLGQCPPPPPPPPPPILTPSPFPFLPLSPSPYPPPLDFRDVITYSRNHPSRWSRTHAHVTCRRPAHSHTCHSTF